MQFIWGPKDKRNQGLYNIHSIVIITKWEECSHLRLQKDNINHNLPFPKLYSLRKKFVSFSAFLGFLDRDIKGLNSSCSLNHQFDHFRFVFPTKTSDLG